jgi:hypothetical protein
MSGLKAEARRVSTSHLAAPTNETPSAPVQQQNTATSPDSNELELSPTPSMSWGNGQTPSGVASSGRRGHRAGLQFGLQSEAVQRRPEETGQRRWSSLNRSGQPCPELLMRLVNAAAGPGRDGRMVGGAPSIDLC